MDNIIIEKKTCSYCGEDISPESRRCPYCGSLVDAGTTNSVVINKPDAAVEENQVTTDITTQETADSITQETADDKKTAVPYEPYRVPDKITAASRLSNALKVFITVVCTVVPGLGQLAGIIIAIIFINSDDDEDRKSFGTALLISSLIVFVITCIFYILLGLGITSNMS